MIRYLIICELNQKLKCGLHVIVHFTTEGKGATTRSKSFKDRHICSERKINHIITQDNL